MGKQLTIKNADFSTNGFGNSLSQSYAGLVFKALEPGFIGFMSVASCDHPQYSFDGISWTDYVFNPTNPEEGILSLEENQEIAFRSNRTGVQSPLFEMDATMFAMSMPCECHGDIAYWAPMDSFAYAMLFGRCPITTPPTLSATTLAEGCYFSMFQSCPLLTQAPALPAPTLAAACYAGLFVDCPQVTEITIQAHGEVPVWDYYQISAITMCMNPEIEGTLYIYNDLQISTDDIPPTWHVEYLS